VAQGSRVLRQLRQGMGTLKYAGSFSLLWSVLFLVADAEAGVPECCRQFDWTRDVTTELKFTNFTSNTARLNQHYTIQ
jgi:hypothetical protein